MAWVEIFVVFVVSHLVGDYLLQTEWQAQNKRGGLRDARARRALGAHMATYTLAFVPAFVWLWDSLGAGVLALALLVAVPHFIQDDVTLLSRFMRDVKGSNPDENPLLLASMDQSFHMVALFLTALVASS